RVLVGVLDFPHGGPHLAVDEGADRLHQQRLLVAQTAERVGLPRFPHPAHVASFRRGPSICTYILGICTARVNAAPAPAPTVCSAAPATGRRTPSHWAEPDSGVRAAQGAENPSPGEAVAAPANGSITCSI